MQAYEAKKNKAIVEIIALGVIPEGDYLYDLDLSDLEDMVKVSKIMDRLSIGFRTGIDAVDAAEKVYSATPANLPCPFCGGINIRTSDKDGVSVVCSECGAQGPSKGSYSFDHALEAWNDRNPQACLVSLLYATKDNA